MLIFTVTTLGDAKSDFTPPCKITPVRFTQFTLHREIECKFPVLGFANTPRCRWNCRPLVVKSAVFSSVG